MSENLDKGTLLKVWWRNFFVIFIDLGNPKVLNSKLESAKRQGLWSMQHIWEKQLKLDLKDFVCKDMWYELWIDGKKQDERIIK